MIHKFASHLMVKIWAWKQKNTTYQTVKFLCDDCGKRGLVLRQISVLNLAFWLLLGIISLIIMRLLDAGWLASGSVGFLVWWISTAINVKMVKPQCRHCRSIQVRIPEKENESEASEISEVVATSQ